MKQRIVFTTQNIDWTENFPLLTQVYCIINIWNFETDFWFFKSFKLLVGLCCEAQEEKKRKFIVML